MTPTTPPTGTGTGKVPSPPGRGAQPEHPFAFMGHPCTREKAQSLPDQLVIKDVQPGAELIVRRRTERFVPVPPSTRSAA